MSAKYSGWIAKTLLLVIGPWGDSGEAVPSTAPAGGSSSPGVVKWTWRSRGRRRRRGNVRIRRRRRETSLGTFALCRRTGVVTVHGQTARTVHGGYARAVAMRSAARVTYAVTGHVPPVTRSATVRLTRYSQDDDEAAILLAAAYLMETTT